MAANNQEVWQRGRVIEADYVATDIKRIVFEPTMPVKAAPGTHLTVAIEINGAIDTRSYSIVASSDDGTRLTLSVFKTRNTRGGAIVMHALAPGDEIAMTQPMQNFPLRVGAERYVLVAGGVGVTAMVNMARVLRSIGANYELVYVGRNREAMAYLDDLAELHGDRLRVFVDNEGNSLNVDELLGSVAAHPLAAETELYMCGPIRLMDGIRRSWARHGLNPPNLRFETFGNSGWFEPEDFVVRIPRLGIETTVGVGNSMLEALEEAGADMMFDCRKGECGLCEVRIVELEGEIDHRDVFFSEQQHRENNKMCCCVSRGANPNASPGTRTVITIDVS